MMIAIPTGCRSSAGSRRLGRPAACFATPLLFVLGFFVIFVIGGLTGVMVASVPLDLQVHDTYFVVAHFHYVLIGGAVFPLLGGIYYWFPKITGRMLTSGWASWNFWLFFIGFNVTFFPMHLSGCRACRGASTPIRRRSGWGALNLLVDRRRA